jgi:hypothetical protein
MGNRSRTRRWIRRRKDTIVPRPLQSLIDQAKRELSDAGFLHGTPDELDGSVNWTLTIEG